MDAKSYSEETIIKNPFNSQSSEQGERTSWMAWEEGHQAGLQAGKREVVEWLMSHGYSGGSIHYSEGIKARFDPPWDEWQELMKEAGL